MDFKYCRETPPGWAGRSRWPWQCCCQYRRSPSRNRRPRSIPPSSFHTSGTQLSSWRLLGNIPLHLYRATHQDSDNFLLALKGYFWCPPNQCLCATVHNRKGNGMWTTWWNSQIKVNKIYRACFSVQLGNPVDRVREYTHQIRSKIALKLGGAMELCVLWSAFSLDSTGCLWSIFCRHICKVFCQAVGHVL